MSNPKLPGLEKDFACGGSCYLEPEKNDATISFMYSTPTSADISLSKYVLRDDLEIDEHDTVCEAVAPGSLPFFNTNFHIRGCALASSSIFYADLLALTTSTCSLDCSLILDHIQLPRDVSDAATCSPERCRI